MWMGLIGCLVVLAGANTVAQTMVPNGDFESGAAGERPPEWGGTRHEAYRIELVEGAARSGRLVARIARAAPGDPPFGSLTQKIDATPLRGKWVRLRGFVRVEGDAPPPVGLWLRVDRQDGKRGFFDNMSERPITSTGWAQYTIEGDVDADATEISFGLLVQGDGIAYLDDVTLEAFDPSSLPPEPPNAAALKYLDEALDVMQQHSVMRHEINWSEFRARAHSYIRGAKGPSETYQGIAHALRDLGDHHSFFSGPLQSAARTAGGGGSGPVVVRLESDRFGYAAVPAYVGGDPVQGAAWATEAQRAIAALAPRSCGWVVDLRQNGGGNMYPMIAALGPLFGEGRLGRFIDPDGASSDWWYRRGAAGEGRTKNVVVDRPLRLRRSPVAVLYGRGTASSGEAIAISFRGRREARSFGEPTGGYSTGNEMYPLSDGATLLLTVAVMADREGRRYGDRVPPDETVAMPADGAAGDPVLDAAKAWLDSQEACTAR